MLLTTILALGAMLGAAGADSCIADNCLRAIRASAFPTRPGTADCSSYFMVTVTPATSTITTVDTIVSTATTDVLARRDGFEKLVVRQVTVSPSSIPAYASPCSGSARYSSACSCIEVTHSTVTVATPLTTFSTTTTTTTTTTITSIVPEPSIEVLQYSDPSCSNPETPPSMVITANSCVLLPFQISENLAVGTFSPGGCDTTAADCTVYYYSSSSCLDVGTSTPASSSSCVAVSRFFSMKLVCPLCPP